MLSACGGYYAHVDAIGEHEEDRAKAGEDSPCIGVKADGDVIRHDLAGGLGLRSKNGISPHLVVLDLVDHLGAEHGMHELGTRDREQCPKESPREKDGQSDGCVRQQASEDSGIAVSKKVPDAQKIHSITGVDAIMRAAYEAVQVCFEGARGLVSPNSREIGSGLSVKQAEFAQFSR